MYSKPAHISASAPTVNSDLANGFAVGQYWWDTATSTEYICTDNKTGAAAWSDTNTGGAYAWTSWTPTFTWTGNTPTGVTYVAEYIDIGDITYFTLQVKGTTGAAGGGLTTYKFDLPNAPVVNENYIPIVGLRVTGGTFDKSVGAYIDATSGAPSGNDVYHGIFTTVPVLTAFIFVYEGFYEKA